MRIIDDPKQLIDDLGRAAHMIETRSSLGSNETIISAALAWMAEDAEALVKKIAAQWKAAEVGDDPTLRLSKDDTAACWAILTAVHNTDSIKAGRDLLKNKETQ